jgi:hypothetical protein
MNLFKKNDKKNSSTKNTPKEGNPMNTSAETKSIDPVKPINSDMVSQNENAPHGNKK